MLQIIKQITNSLPWWRAYACTAAGVLLVAAAGALHAQPFDMPPSGQPERLLLDPGWKGPTAMAFDSKNRPYLINNRNRETFGLIETVRDGEWVTLSFRDALADGLPDKLNAKGPGNMVIDDDDALYAIVGRNTLLYSPDLGKTFQTYPLRGASLEVRTSPAQTVAIPAIQVTTDYRSVDRRGEREPHMAWWSRRATLSVLLPTKNEKGLELGEPILITENCGARGGGSHFGGTSGSVTLGRKTHVVYAESPEDVRTGGNPIHIATIHRDSRTVMAREFLVNAPPKKSDVHTSPTITVDGNGYLHVLSGSHNQPFFYTRSLEPNDITAGWTKPVQLKGRQCYASLVCDADNRLHSAFREWIPHASLGYSHASAPDWDWRGPKTLVHGANPKGVRDYGIFYHRLFIDRASNLYLGFTFFEFTTGKDGDYPEALIVSQDGGASWQLADRQTLADPVAH